MGIGSEVYMALKRGRKPVGFELKDTYFAVAKQNAQRALDEEKQMDMFG
jgi:hypothetical protein